MLTTRFVQLVQLIVTLVFYTRTCNGFIKTATLPNGIRNVHRLMAIPPIGPFCPFRSQAAVEMEPKMSKLNSATPEFAMEMARINYDIQMGTTPDPDNLRKVASEIKEAVEDWENLITRLRISSDFQTREYAKLTQAHLDSHGQTSNEVAKVMKWQSQCLYAMADNTSPPPPPPDVDLMKMMSAAEGQQQNKPPPSISAMANAEYINTTPFEGSESAFESPIVREEYEQLCRDHNQIIGMGGKYSNFDPLGKIAYLDMIDKIEDRWDIFFARFSLMGSLNKQFVKECNAFLESMSLNEEEFRVLLSQAHTLMREDAERERS